MKNKILILNYLTMFIFGTFQFHAQAGNTMVILQENQGKVGLLNLPKDTPSNVITAISAVMDAFAENFEDIKSKIQGSGKYSKIVALTDVNCTRAKLLQTLISETDAGNTVDLYFFGHGNSSLIELHGREDLRGGTTNSLRTLLTDARTMKRDNTFGFRLRLVYSCACVGEGLNDDWLAIGAKVSVGSLCDNWMAEPMITLFLNKY